MTGLEKAIRTNGYRRDGNIYRLNTVKYWVTESEFNAAMKDYENEKYRNAYKQSHLWENPDNVEHTASMTDILAAYADYRLAAAY